MTARGTAWLRAASSGVATLGMAARIREGWVSRDRQAQHADRGLGVKRFQIEPHRATRCGEFQIRT